MPLPDNINLRKGDLVTVPATVRWDFGGTAADREFVFLLTPNGRELTVRPEEIASIVRRVFHKDERVRIDGTEGGVVKAVSDDGKLLWVKTDTGYTTVAAARAEIDPDLAEVDAEPRPAREPAPGAAEEATL